MHSALQTSLQLTSTWVWLMGDERLRGKRGWVRTACFLLTPVAWAVAAALHNYNTRQEATPQPSALSRHQGHHILRFCFPPGVEAAVCCCSLSVSTSLAGPPNPRSQ